MRPYFVAAVAGLGLVGCASVPPPAPVLTFDRHDCAEVDLTRAISLTPDKERALHSVTTVIDSATPCATLASGASAYVLFAVPEDFEDKTLTVGAALEATRIFSPTVSVLDAAGQETRRFASDEFMYRGANFSVLFRPRAAERYVLVSSDPSRVGQRYDSINIGTSSTTTYTPYGGATFTSGVDASLSRTFSYEGSALVVINDSDPKEKPAEEQ
ncbi:hypothetical protein GCM10017620_00860 [Brevundimonas intermedia]|uniref:Lipoprotein n=1 Tax=Brevundimonas intermedia TaxID=74315 RepID=A0ABQ5T6X0_9CAUL|nr:MalM family protein [Brevundimonas intermedia]GLK47113.1 hypothetical protein GCM10017620_00860 [Brevundimonas intermedia]